MTSRIKGILFDNDGTLVDTRDLILKSMRHATDDVLGKVFPDEDYLRMVGLPLVDQMKDFSTDPVEQERMIESYRTFNHERHDELIRSFPGASDALHELLELGFRLGVVTSKMHWLALRGLEITGLSPFLELLIGADDCTVHKPAPDPVLAGCERLGLAPEECAYVGDATFDVDAGNAAGCTTIAVTWGMGDPADLAACRPDVTCDSFSSLVEALKDMR